MIVGGKYNRLTVIKLSDKKNNRNERLYECKCDCGNTVYLEKHTIVSGNTKSCGCYKIDSIKSRWFEPIYPGEKFGRLTVIGVESSKRGVSYNCKCDCGNYKVVRGGNLRNGSVTSCGCAVVFANRTREKDSRNKSGFKGVCYCKQTGKYAAYITFNKKRYNLGRWFTAEQAHKIRLLAEEEILKPWIQSYETQNGNISVEELENGFKKLIEYQKSLCAEGYRRSYQ